MNRIFIVIFCLFLLNGCTAKIDVSDKRESEVLFPKKLIINNKTISVDLATTRDEQATGLAGKSELADDYGLLFLFDNKRIRNFWMKGMIVPIDIIWINDNEIAYITEKVSLTAKGEPHQLYSSSKSVDKVLEVKAGLVEQNGWTIGDKIQYIE